VGQKKKLNFVDQCYLYIKYWLKYNSLLCKRERNSKLSHIYRTIKNKGRFIMYSGIKKINYRKTAGHIFTKPVQIEGKTQKVFSQ